MVKKGLLVKLKARAGQEAEVEKFLAGGLEIVNEEPFTRSWYAIKFDDANFGIFDTFDDDEGRDAHLGGRLAEALLANAERLFAEPPSIEKIDVLAAK